MLYLSFIGFYLCLSVSTEGCTSSEFLWRSVSLPDFLRRVSFSFHQPLHLSLHRRPRSQEPRATHARRCGWGLLAVSKCSPVAPCSRRREPVHTKQRWRSVSVCFCFLSLLLDILFSSRYAHFIYRESLDLFFTRCRFVSRLSCVFPESEHRGCS